MDTPILPNPSDDVPPAPRAARTIWLLRTAAAVIGLLTSLLTLTHSWDFAVRSALGLKGPADVWGTPDGGRVCTDEVRAHAHGGAWHCIYWFPVARDQKARAADDGQDGRVCSHRVVIQGMGVWDCVATGDMSPIAVRYKGGVPQPVFGERFGKRLCIDEWRNTLTGPWTCAKWGVRVPNVYFAEARPSGVACINARWADMDTGSWACGLRPTQPGAYYGIGDAS